MAIQIFETEIDRVFILDFLAPEKRKNDTTPVSIESFLVKKCDNVESYHTDTKADFIDTLIKIKTIVDSIEKKNTLLYFIGDGASDLIGTDSDLPREWTMNWAELLPYLRDINYATGNKLFLNAMFVCYSSGMLEHEDYSTDCFHFFLGNCKGTKGLGDVLRHNTETFPCYTDRDGLYKIAKDSQFSFDLMKDSSAFCMIVNENFAPLLDSREHCINEEVLQLLMAKQEAGYHTDERMMSSLQTGHPTYKIILKDKKDFLGLIFHEISPSRLLTQGGRRSLKDVIAQMQKSRWTLKSLVTNLDFDPVRQHDPEWFRACIDIYENFDMNLFSPIFLQDAKKNERIQTPGSGYYLLDGTHRSLVLAWKLLVEDFAYVPIEAYVLRPRAY